MIGDCKVRKSNMSRLAGMIGNSKVKESGVSRQTHLESAARHELLDNVEAGGHALGGLGLHAPHPLELHYMPAIRSTSCVLIRFRQHRYASNRQFIVENA